MESRDKDGEVRHAKMTQADFELVEVLANLMGRPLHQRDWAAVQLVADARAEWERKSATGQVSEWMIQHGYVTGHGDTLDDLLRALVGEVKRKCLEATTHSPEAAERSKMVEAAKPEPNPSGGART